MLAGLNIPGLCFRVTRVGKSAEFLGRRLCNKVRMNRTKIAVCQLTCTADKEKNFVMGSSLVERAKTNGAEMVFLPENADYICDGKDQTLAMAESVDGPFVMRYRALAKDLGVWLSIGGFHEKSDDPQRIYNSHLVIDGKGCIRGKYSKTHLFCVDIPGKVKLNEADACIPGKLIVPPFATPVGMLGMAICYDLRFPELSTILRQLGADVLTYPSAFTQPTGEAHWEVLLRCRAIENQCYVVAAAQTGQHNPKRASHGHSMIIDPWGKVLKEIQDGVDVAIAEIDSDYLQKVRQEMPVQLHRRHDLYSVSAVAQVGSPAIPVDAQTLYAFSHLQIKASAVFYRSALSFAFVNINPVLPGHILVSPLRVVPRFSEMSAAETADLFTTVRQLAPSLEKHYACSSVTIAVQDGPAAGQSVPHVHVHVLPRRDGDFKRNDDIYHELQQHDKQPTEEGNSESANSGRLLRSDDDMAAEAHLLRKYFYSEGSRL